jgi:hypothetical protein
VALVPKPSETDEHLFIVATQGRLRVLSRIALAGDVCRLAWASPHRLLAVVTSGSACYQPIDAARLLVIDPAAGRVVAQRSLSGPATVVATEPIPGGLALLLRPQGTSDLHLMTVDAVRTRAFVLGGISSPARALDKAVGSTLGLALDAPRHAYVVEPNGRISDVNLVSGAVAVHKPPARSTAAATKGIAQAEVQAVSLSSGLLAYSGIHRSDGRLVPIGLRLVDTCTWHARLLSANATGFAYAADTLIAYQPFVDQLGRRIPRVGVRAYTADGRRLLRAFANEQVEFIRHQGRFVYLSGPGGMSVLDLETRKLDVSVTEAYTGYELLAGAGSLAFPS